MTITKEQLAQSIVNDIRMINDFPIKGIKFFDIMPLMENPRHLQNIVDHLANRYLNDVPCDAFATIESRGFLIGSALAYKLRKPLVPIRKKGKLPGEVVSMTYQKEYGTDVIEVHKHHPFLKPGQNIVFLDDLIATGGSSLASIHLLKQFGVQISEAAFLMELKELNGSEILQKEHISSYSILTL